MSTKQISGTIKNPDGGVTPFTGTIQIIDAPVLTSLTVSPQPAPAGTSRTITVVGSDPNGEALTYECAVDGVELAPTATPGVFTWAG